MKKKCIKLRHDITFSLLITQFRLSDVLFIVFIIVMKKNYILTISITQMVFTNACA